MAVAIGWHLDLQWLTSLHPEWVSMKLVTALGFVLAGFSAAFDGRTAQTLAVTLALGSVHVLMVGGIGPEVSGTLNTIAPNQPSHMTILGFIQCAYTVFLRRGWWIVSAIGFVALAGYVLGFSGLMFHSQHSTAMAAHTAVGFVLMGAALRR